MVDNQEFIEKTNFLKNEKKINFSVQSEKLGVERHIFDAWRVNRTEVPAHIWAKMPEIWPELTEYTYLPPPSNLDALPSNVGQTLANLVETQKKLIAMMESELENKAAEVERLRAEVEQIKKRH